MRKVIALVMIVALVIPLLLVTLGLFSVGSWVLKRSFYTDLLSDIRMYEALLKEPIPGEDHVFSEWTETGAFGGVPGSALARALREVVTPAYLRSLALQALNDTFDALEKRKPELSLNLDLAPLKSSLYGAEGKRFARALAAALPPCPQQGSEPSTAEGAIPRCRPPEVPVETLAEIIFDSLPAYLAGIPDTYPVQPHPIVFAYNPRNDFWYGFISTNHLLWIGFFMAVISLSFLLASALIAAGGRAAGSRGQSGRVGQPGRERRQLILWIAWPLFIPALLIFLSGAVIWVAASVRWVFYPGLEPWLHESFRYAGEIRDALFPVVRSAMIAAARAFLAAGGLTLGVALGLMIWALSIPKVK